MANYLPVLLVSVSTNAVPDDSSFSTLPRAQVDYLSHEWAEEDVWRSWRNMTRQKNEIANGIRLENASWRTWWKQRNKLKTITPETLNWLKDSDVTWLYGPFHSAVDWAPPPKPSPVPDSVDTLTFASAHDRLDLSTPAPRARPNPQRTPSKPILKHRSISELLLASGDGPTSPIFSPAESEDDDEHDPFDDPLHAAMGGGAFPKRPSLLHTKSDTHITRWGSSRSFRKDSPPRIHPPGSASAHASSSSTNLDVFFAPGGPGHASLESASAGGSIRPSNSQDSHTSAGSGSSGERKKKHISFNTFVEQCIAIEKPKKSAMGIPGFGPSPGGGPMVWGDDDDGYEEDQEYSGDDEEAAWDQLSGSAIGSDSDSPFEDEADEAEEDEEEEDEDIIEMRRPTSHRDTQTPGKKKPPRSNSKVSTASSSSSASTSTASTSTTSSSSHTQHTHKRERRNSSSTYRPARRRPPPLIRTLSDHVQHVTIAPIAPTILKTGAWSEGFGDEGGVGSDDGLVWRWGGGVGEGKGKGREESDGTPVELVYVPPFGSNYSLHVPEEDEDEDEGVVMPVRAPRIVEEEEGFEEEYLEESVGGLEAGYLVGGVQDAHTVYRPGFGDYSDNVPAQAPSAPIPVPTLVVESGRVTEDEDAYRFFEGPDIGAEYAAFTRAGAGGGAGRKGTYRELVQQQTRDRDVKEREREEGRSLVQARSRSRTPSPAVVMVPPEGDTTPRAEKVPVSSPSSFATPTPTPTGSNLPTPTPTSTAFQRRRSLSVSPSSPSALLSPPPRGRSFNDLPSQSQTRGRSSTRTPSSSSSFSDRERQGSWSSSTSPIGGSLSPDGGAGFFAGAYAGSRIDREREREKQKREKEGGGGRERGRDRTGKRLSVSVSPEAPVGPVVAIAPKVVCEEPLSLASLGEGEEKDTEKEKEKEETQSVLAGSIYAESVSSTSSGNTVVPEGSKVADGTLQVMSSSSDSTTPMQVEESEEERNKRREEAFLRKAEEEHERRAEEEVRRRVHPTPSNSPVLTMRPPPRGAEHESASSSTSTSSSTPTPTHTPAAPSLQSTRSPPPTKLPIPKSPFPAPSPPLPAHPSTSSFSAQQAPQSPKSPSSPTGSGGVGAGGRDGKIMGKAVGMVSSAGAYLGLWQQL